MRSSKRRQPSVLSKPRRIPTLRRALQSAEKGSPVGRWAKKRLQALSEEGRLASINDLRLARNYVDMHRETHRLAARYAGIVRRAQKELASLVSATPDFCGSLPAILKSEELPERLDRVASAYEAVGPTVRAWQRERPDPYVKVLTRQRSDGVEVFLMDGQMPIQQQEALEAQRHGCRVYARLRQAGMPTGEASRLAREGLRVAGLKVDRAVSLDWKGVTIDEQTLALQNQPVWLYEVAVGGAKQRVAIDIHAEVNWWLALLDAGIQFERKRDWDPWHSTLLEAISRELKAREAPALSEEDRVQIRRRLNRKGGPDRVLARRLASRTTGLSEKQIARRDITSNKK